MFRRLLLPLFLALLSLPAFAAAPITVSGTNQTVGTTGVQGNSFVRFRLRNFAGFVPKVFGTGVLVQTQLDVLPAADGTFTTPLWSNDDIIPNTCGVTGNLACTWYTVEFWNGGKITASGSYCVPNTSSTYDLNVAVPCATPPLPPGPVQITSVTGATINGTPTHVLKFVGPTTAGDSEGVATGTTAAVWPLGTNIATAGLEFQKQNSSSPGTTQFLLAAKDPTTGLARDAQPTDSNSLIGVSHTGTGTSGLDSIVFAGGAQCRFDNQTSIGDWVILGASSQCHDAGTTQPVGVMSIARISSVNAGAGTIATVDVGLPEVTSNSANTTSGGNGTVLPSATNGAVGFYNAIGNTIGPDPNFTDDGAGNLAATSLLLNGTGGGFQFFGQGVQPTLSQSNAVYFYAPASVPTSFGTAWPSAPGVAGQTLVITSVPDATHIVLGYATIACPGSCIGTAPTGNQTLTNGFNLINSAGGSFVTTNTGATPTDTVFSSYVDALGRGTLDNVAGAGRTRLEFLPGGPIVFKPIAAGTEGFAGAEIDDSGLYITGHFTDGTGITIGNGNIAVEGAGLSLGDPVGSFGSSGIEGVIRTVPNAGGGTYTIRSPVTSNTNVINWPNANGTLAIVTAGVLMVPAVSLSGTTGTPQCLQADATGAVTGTGATCAGTSSPGGANTNLQYNNSGAFGGFADGTSTQVLHGGRTFGSIVNADIAAATIDLTTKVTGVLPTANGGSTNGFFAVSGPASSVKTFTFPNASATVLTSNAAVTVAQGGTGLSSGTSGGVPYFSSTTALSSSALLTANALMIGGGAGAAPSVLGSLGTTTTVLHGNAGGASTYGSIVNADIAASTIDLTAKVTGVLPTGNGGVSSVFLTSAYTNATTTPSNLTDGSHNLAFSVLANTNYDIECSLPFDGSTTAAGLELGITGPASPTALVADFFSSTSHVAFNDDTQTAYGGTWGTAAALGSIGYNHIGHLWIHLVNGANAGTVQIQGRTAISGTVTVAAGAGCTVHQ